MSVASELIIGRRYRLSVGPSEFPFPGLDGAPPVDKHDAHVMRETYVCAQDHKAYAIRRDKLELYALLHPSAPTFAMRSFVNDLMTRLATLTQASN